MSKQLAIASTFATFAMACLVVLNTDAHRGQGAGEAMASVQAEAPSFDLPVPSLFPG